MQKNKINRQVVKHLRDDIKTFSKEAEEDKELIGKLSKKGTSMPRKKGKKDVGLMIMISKKKPKKSVEKCKEKKESFAHEKRESKKEKKFEKVMREYKAGKLHSGSKKGPKVKKKKQALAIAISESKRKKKK